MLLCFIGIECDFVLKQWMDLILLNKRLIAQSKEVISLIVFDDCLEDFRTSVNAYT